MADTPMARACRAVCQAVNGHAACTCKTNYDSDPFTAKSPHCEALVPVVQRVLLAFSITLPDAERLASGTHTIRKRPIRKAKGSDND